MQNTTYKNCQTDEITLELENPTDSERWLIAESKKLSNSLTSRLDVWSKLREAYEKGKRDAIRSISDICSS